MPYSHDIGLYSLDRTLQLVAHIHTQRAHAALPPGQLTPCPADLAWAARVRQYLFSNNGFPTDVPYFLLVTPDLFFLWKRETPLWTTGGSPALPDFTGPARPLLEPKELVYERSDDDGLWLKQITRHDLTVALLCWFDSFLYADHVDIFRLYPLAPWLFLSGLYDLVKFGDHFHLHECPEASVSIQP